MSHHTILLVEDNPDDEILTIRALRKGKTLNEIIVVHDGEEALAYLFNEEESPHHPTPELILLDLRLPKIDGLEVLRHLRRHPRTKLLPVVVLTTSDEERDVLQSYDLGANSYIRKPVDFAQFMKAVQQLELYWLVLNVAPPLSSAMR